LNLISYTSHVITFIEIHVPLAVFIEIMRNNIGIICGGVFFARSLQWVKFIKIFFYRGAGKSLVLPD